MSDKTVYKLTQPVTIKKRTSDNVEIEETLTEVSMRTPITRDLRVTDYHEGEVAKSIALIAHLSGLTIKEVDQFAAPDFIQLSTVVSGFTQLGQVTGGTS